MVDVWDLASYVEAHPENHEQRWRLAKKLYMTCDYRHALEHLQILKNEWRPRVNVVRYLAATYYRLGRYDEALRELDAGMGRWPDEIALREQAARVLEVAERYESALDAWREIQQISAEHPVAARAIARLDAYLTEATPPEMPIGDSDSGIDISGVVCSVCGAQNSVGFSRCWQCHALLDERAVTANPVPQAGQRAPSRTMAPGGRLQTGLALVAVAAISLSVYLTMANLAELEALRDPVLSLRAFLEREFAHTRALLGGVAALLWPVTLWLAIKVIDDRGADAGSRSAVIGLCAAAAGYLCTWFPGYWIAAAPVLALAVALGLMTLMLDLRPGQIVAAFALHAALLATVMLAGFIAMEGIGPVRDAAALVRFAQATAGDGTGVYRAPHLAPDKPVHLRWTSTGSPWLDSQPHVAEFVFEKTSPVYVELLLEGRVKKGRTIEQPRTTFSESPIWIGQTYTMRLHDEGTTAPITFLVQSLPQPIFSP